MKLRDIMTDNVVRIDPNETVAVAARTLTHYNIGALPVCGQDGTLQGMVTDRDLVVRCVASDRSPAAVRVGEVMTGKVVCADPDMDVQAAAQLMGREQIRRLPVVERGQLCGMVSLGDIAGRTAGNSAAAGALGEICTNISRR